VHVLFLPKFNKNILYQVLRVNGVMNNAGGEKAQWPVKFFKNLIERGYIFALK
jgi:hypothetical protein